MNQAGKKLWLRGSCESEKSEPSRFTFTEEHDPSFRRSTGIFPGVTECFALEVINDDGSPDVVKFIMMDLSKIQDPIL